MIDSTHGTLLMLVAWPHSIAEIRSVAEAHLGLALPDGPGHSTRRGDSLAMTVARGRWFLDIADRQAAETLCRDIPTDAGATVDLTSARTVFTLAGPHALEVARKLAAVDFDLPENGPGAFIQGGSRHEVGFLMLRQQEGRFRLYVDSGYAGSFAESLDLLSAEFRAVSIP